MAGTYPLTWNKDENKLYETGVKNVVLYLKDENEFARRLKRDKHEYQEFNVESSVRQQNEYLKLADEVEKETKKITTKTK